MLNVFYLYDRWADLSELTADVLPKGHAEEPWLHSKRMEGGFLLYVPFVSVDTDRFLSFAEEVKLRKK